MTADPAVLLVPGVLAMAAVAALSGGGLARRRLRRRTQPVPDSGGTARAGRGGGPADFGAPAGGGAGSPPGPGLHDVAMMLELIGAMLDAGAGIGRSLALVAELATPGLRVQLRPVVAALAVGTDWDTAWRSSGGGSPGLHALRGALGFAAHTGAPSSAILYAQAARLRRERFRTAEKQAAALGVTLVVPLGLCSLPAFVCLGVVPVLLAMLPR